MLKKLQVPRVMLILVVGSFVNSVGTSFLWPLNSLFMHDILGRSLTEAGLVIALQSGANMAGQLVSGFLADRFGPKKIMVAGLLLAGATVSTIGFFPVWRVYGPGIIFLGLTLSMIFVPLNALVTILWPEGGRKGYNYIYVASNAGVAVGTALGGIVAQVSFRWVFWGNAATYLVYLTVILIGLPWDARSRRSLAGTKKPKGKVTLTEAGFRPLLAVGGGIFLVWSAYIQWTTVLPVGMKQRGFSLPSYSLLWTLNGVLIVTLQPLINWIIRSWAHTFRRQFYLACILISSSFVILQGHLPYGALVLAMLVLTLGEMLILPAVPAVAAHLAPQGKEGAYQGVVAGAASAGRMLGPFLGGMVFDSSGDSWVWLMAIGFMAAAFGVFAIYGRIEKRSAPADGLSM